jgi:hypothetical protein
MRLDHDRRSLLALLGISAGVATGVAAGVWLWRRRTDSLARDLERWGHPRGSAQDVADAFRADSRLSGRRIDVDTIAEGVVELSGAVRDRAEADRAVGIAQGTTGVYTVVNRLRIEAEESHRESNRRRWDEGAPDLRERKHYGMGVGMGTARHSTATDPPRPSDKQQMVERELDVDRVADRLVDPEEDVAVEEPVVPAVHDPDLKPGDEAALRDAGLHLTPAPEGGTDGAEPDGGLDEGGEDRT